MKQLPPEMLKRTRTIADIRNGERAWAWLSALKVDEQGRCWLRRNSWLESKSWGMQTVEIFRSGGEFHIIIPEKEYDPGEAPLSTGNLWLPVTTVQIRRRSWLHRLQRA